MKMLLYNFSVGNSIFIICSLKALIIINILCYNMVKIYSANKKGSSLEPVGKNLQYSRNNLIKL